MNLVDLFNDIGEDLVKEIKKGLIESGKVATGKLVRSIDYRLIVLESQRLVRELKIEVLGEDYLRFADEGRKPGRQPPISVIENWIKVKNIKGRDKKGRFIKRKSLAFAIARSIGKVGSPAKKGVRVPAPNVVDKSTKIVLDRYKKQLTEASIEEFNKIITKFFQEK